MASRNAFSGRAPAALPQDAGRASPPLAFVGNPINGIHPFMADQHESSFQAEAVGYLLRVEAHLQPERPKCCYHVWALQYLRALGAPVIAWPPACRRFVNARELFRLTSRLTCRCMDAQSVWQTPDRDMPESPIRLQSGNVLLESVPVMCSYALESLRCESWMYR